MRSLTIGQTGNENHGIGVEQKLCGFLLDLIVGTIVIFC